MHNVMAQDVANLLAIQETIRKDQHWFIRVQAQVHRIEGQGLLQGSVRREEGLKSQQPRADESFFDLTHGSVVQIHFIDCGLHKATCDLKPLLACR